MAADSIKSLIGNDVGMLEVYGTMPIAADRLETNKEIFTLEIKIFDSSISNSWSWYFLIIR